MAVSLRWAPAVALVAAALLSAATAHVRWAGPMPRSANAGLKTVQEQPLANAGGLTLPSSPTGVCTPLRAGTAGAQSPCGGVAAGNPQTLLLGGQTVTVHFQETICHAGTQTVGHKKCIFCALPITPMVSRRLARPNQARPSALP